MAQNINLGDGLTFYEPSVPEGIESGDALVLGDNIPAIALTDRDGNGGASVIIRGGVTAKLSVVAQSYDTGTSAYVDDAIDRWDKLYYDSSADVINKNDSSGVFFGYAMGAVTAGSTDTIEVLLG